MTTSPIPQADTLDATISRIKALADDGGQGGMEELRGIIEIVAPLVRATYPGGHPVIARIDAALPAAPLTTDGAGE